MMDILSGIRIGEGAKKADKTSMRLTGRFVKNMIKYAAKGRVIKPTQPPRAGSD